MQFLKMWVWMVVLERLMGTTVWLRMNEEHGIVSLAPGFTPNVGAKLAFLRSCLTTAELSDEVVVVQQGKVKNLWHAATHERRQ